MSARTIRRAVAAAVTAVALVGAGAVTASAVDQVPDNQFFGGTLYLADANEGTDHPVGGTLPFNAPTIGLVAAGDLEGTFPVPADATGVFSFIAPQGQENEVTAWNAQAVLGLTPSGILLPPLSLNVQQNGGGTPKGAAAVAAAGGDYSVGIAFTRGNGLIVVDDGLYFVHVTVTPGTLQTATYTWDTVEVESTKTATTTTITSAPTTVQENTAFDLTATVSEAAATGTVQFKDGANNLGSPASLSGGVATLNVAAGLAAGNHSITAVYSGDSAFDGSTSAAVTVEVTGEPQATTTTVSATSADGVAGHPVTLTADVSAANATTPTGTVTFTGSVDGGSVVTIASNVAVGGSGTASILTNALATAGTWTIDAAFTGTGVYEDSASTTSATLVLGASTFPEADPDEQTVEVEIPQGTLTITTPYTPANPLQLGTATLHDDTSTWSASAAFGSTSDIDQAIKIVDTRAGQPGFTAQVASTDFSSGGAANQQFAATFASLTGLQAHPVVDNALLASDITTTDIASLSNAPQTFATYPAGKSLGTAWLSGTFGIANVPTSILPGTYTATVTFTAF